MFVDGLQKTAAKKPVPRKVGGAGPKKKPQGKVSAPALKKKPRAAQTGFLQRMSDGVSDAWSNTKKQVSDSTSAAWKSTKKQVSKTYNAAAKGATNAKNSFISGFKNMTNSVGEEFNRLKSDPGKRLGQYAKKTQRAVGKVVGTPIGYLGKGLGKTYKGLNTVAGGVAKFTGGVAKETGKAARRSAGLGKAKGGRFIYRHPILTAGAVLGAAKLMQDPSDNETPSAQITYTGQG